MAALVETLAGLADIVIFDSPPVLAVTDAAVLARQVDGVLLVVDAGHTKEHALAAAADELQKTGGNVLGVALNRLDTRRGYNYYYYYYYSGRGKRGKKAVQAPAHAGCTPAAAVAEAGVNADPCLAASRPEASGNIRSLGLKPSGVRGQLSRYSLNKKPGPPFGRNLVPC